jgi:hypothetical protein
MSAHDAGARIDMNHHRHATLQAIFAHPVSANIDPRQAFALIETLGGEVSHGGHGHIIVKLGGHTHGFHDVHHALPKDDVVTLRKFLEQAGFTPDKAA